MGFGAWRALAQHEAGNYQDAIETGKTLRDGAGQYNLGNSLARPGRLDEALAAYNEALQLNPADQDAKYNRKLIQKLREQKKEEQQTDQTGNSNGQQQQNNEQKQGQLGGENNRSKRIRNLATLRTSSRMGSRVSRATINNKANNPTPPPGSRRTSKRKKGSCRTTERKRTARAASRNKAFLPRKRRSSRISRSSKRRQPDRNSP